MRLLDKMGQWKDLVVGKGAQPVALLYVDEPAGGRCVVDSNVGRRLKQLAEVSPKHAPPSEDKAPAFCSTGCACAGARDTGQDGSA